MLQRACDVYHPDVRRSMRNSGVYCDTRGDGGWWELAQALRWIVTGEIFNPKDEKWEQSPDFSGFGLSGGKSHIVLEFLLDRYAPMHWPDHCKTQRVVLALTHGLCVPQATGSNR
jgi:hypothetical protein